MGFHQAPNLHQKNPRDFPLHGCGLHLRACVLGFGEFFFGWDSWLGWVLTINYPYLLPPKPTSFKWMFGDFQAFPI